MLYLSSMMFALFSPILQSVMLSKQMFGKYFLIHFILSLSACSFGLAEIMNKLPFFANSLTTSMFLNASKLAKKPFSLSNLSNALSTLN